MNLVFCEYRGILVQCYRLGMINVPPSCYNHFLNKYFGDEILVHAVLVRFAATFLFVSSHSRSKRHEKKNKVKKLIARNGVKMSQSEVSFHRALVLILVRVYQSIRCQLSTGRS